MSEYCPDRWVIIRIKSDEFGTVDKLYSGNYGGWAGSDTWKMNSGIKCLHDKGEYYDVIGPSGSVYKCYKAVEGMSIYMQGMLEYFRSVTSEHPFTIDVIGPEEVQLCV